MAGAEVSSQVAVNDAASQAGVAIGTGLGMGMGGFITFSALIGGLIGYILIMKKKVYKCEACGYVMDRD